MFQDAVVNVMVHTGFLSGTNVCKAGREITCTLYSRLHYTSGLMSLFSEALRTAQQKAKRMQEKQVNKTEADVPVQHFYLAKTAIMSIGVNNRRNRDRGE